MPGAPFQKNAVAVKAFHVSWDRFHRDARALAWRLSAAGRFLRCQCEKFLGRIHSQAYKNQRYAGVAKLVDATDLNAI